MIVKNIPDYHLPTQTHLSSNPNSKPYFLQGLEYSKNILLKLKKQKLQKQNDLQYSSSPSHSPSPQTLQSKSNKKSNKILKKQYPRQKIKNLMIYSHQVNNQPYKKIQQQQEHLNHTDNITLSLQTTKIKSFGNGDKNLIGQFIKYHQQQQNIQNLLQPLQQQKKSLSTLQLIKQYEQQINQVGQCLQNIYNQLEYYQVIFDNLCDCYRNNQSIVIKNNKLKRQALRLQQQKNAIINQLNVVCQEFQHFDLQEKQSNKIIGQYVEEYVKNICYCNLEESISVLGQSQIQKQNEIIEIDDQEEMYQDKLNLNYKNLRQRYEDKIKKKKVTQAKKLQKGISFQEQNNAISKYYQSEFSNI